MLALRRLLQVASGLLCIAVVLAWLMSPNPDYEVILSALGVSILFILVLGPWWPSADNTMKWKLGLPTDNPKVAAFLLGLIVGSFSFYNAWDSYLHPDQKLPRFIGLIAETFGSNSVVIFWVLMGISCLWGLFQTYKRSKNL